jgi:KUP system potassium uptake protein
MVQEDNSALGRVARKTTPAAALAALGIVYGDLGTSPLYTLQAVVGATGGHFSPEAALGSLSLIFWALIITISVKHCLFVMRADNHGEGGILALMSMSGANWSKDSRDTVIETPLDELLGQLLRKLQCHPQAAIGEIEVEFVCFAF